MQKNPEEIDMAKRKGSLKGLRKARCVREGMSKGHSKSEARKKCGVKSQ